MARLSNVLMIGLVVIKPEVSGHEKCQYIITTTQEIEDYLNWYSARVTILSTQMERMTGDHVLAVQRQKRVALGGRKKKRRPVLFGLFHLNDVSKEQSEE